MKFITVKLDNLTPARWRFSEPGETPIFKNIARSLETHGQLAPIHVRRLDNKSCLYEIVDGHIVVEVARTLGWKELEAVVHEDLNDGDALLRYVHLNQNRGSEQYGHDHVKMHRVFNSAPAPSSEEKKDLIAQHPSWPLDRILNYILTDENSKNWAKFMYPPNPPQKDFAAVHDWTVKKP